jgi:hypothetical protein
MRTIGLMSLAIGLAIASCATAQQRRGDGNAVITPRKTAELNPLPSGDILKRLKGDQGPQGPAGNDGKAATVTIGTVTTGPPGSEAKVTNRGTSNAAVLDFVLPRGKDGADGTDGLPAKPFDPKELDDKITKLEDRLLACVHAGTEQLEAENAKLKAEIANLRDELAKRPTMEQVLAAIAAQKYDARLFGVDGKLIKQTKFGVGDPLDIDLVPVKAKGGTEHAQR